MTIAAQAELASQFSRSFASLLGAQARALVVERQPEASDEGDPLLTAAAQTQRRLREKATYLLSEVVPAAIADVLTPADRVISVATALQSNLPARGTTSAPADEVRRLANYLRALADVISGAKAKTLEFAKTNVVWVKAVDEVTDQLNEATRAMVDSLEGEDGRAGVIQALIATKREEIDSDIDDIVVSADEIGEKAGELASEALAFIKPGGKKKKKKKDKEPDDTSGGGDKPKPDTPEPEEEEQEDEGDDDAFDETRAKEIGAKTVQALKGAGDGARDLGAAAARLAQHNKELADLYYDLASVKGNVAWARAIGDQGRSLRRAADNFGDALEEIASGWGTIVKDLLTQADAIEGSGDVSILSKRWTNAEREAWQALADRLLKLRSAMAGRTRLIAL